MSINQVLEMPYTHLLGWFEFFERRPVGWRDDDRVAKLMQVGGAKGKPYEFFTSLKPIYKPVHQGGEKTQAVESLGGSLMLHKMLGAKGGDKLEL